MLRSEIEARIEASYKVQAEYDKDLIRLHKLKDGIQSQIDRLNDQLSELEDT